jgi:hypothetical protein
MELIFVATYADGSAHLGKNKIGCFVFVNKVTNL